MIVAAIFLIAFVVLLAILTVVDGFLVNPNFHKLEKKPFHKIYFHLTNFRYFIVSRIFRLWYPEGNVGRIKQLYVYPIKSAGNMPVTQWEMDEHGFKHDRQYALSYFDESAHQFKIITQRECPKLSFLKLEYFVDDKGQDWFKVFYLNDHSKYFQIPGNFTEELIKEYCDLPDTEKDAVLWGIEMKTLTFKENFLPVEFLQWAGIFDRYPKKNVFRLLYSRKGKLVSFAAPGDLPKRSSLFHDYFPMLILAQKDVNWLNKKISEDFKDPLYPVAEALNFRPNILLEGTKKPFDIDTWQTYNLITKHNNSFKFGLNNEKASNSSNFDAPAKHKMKTMVKCGRCIIPNVDVGSGNLDRKKLYMTKTLNKYRRVDAVTTLAMMGITAIHYDSGYTLSVGDEFEVTERKINVYVKD